MSQRYSNLKMNFYKVLVLFNKTESSITIAASASTIGTARGTTQGSWRPLPIISTSSPLEFIVGCVWIKVATGLNATLK